MTKCYQNIAHKNSSSLNELLKNDPSLHLPTEIREELDKLRRIPRSPVSDDDGIYIQVAQQRFIDYLRNRFSQSMGL